MLELRNYGVRWFVSLLLLCILCQPAEAHFLFVYSEDGKIKVVFGEDLEPDQAQFLSGLSEMKSYTNHAGVEQEITFEKVTEGDSGWFELSAAKAGQAIDITCPYGVFGRGDKTMFLDYSAKYIRHVANGTDQLPTKPSPALALDLVPELVAGQLKLTAYFKGQPLSDAAVELVRVKTEPVEVVTDETGSVLVATNSRFLVRAKHTVNESGEADGKSFAERRFYCTMVLDVEAGTDIAGTTVSSASADRASTSKHADSSVTLKKLDSRLADFPRAMTSFGATVVDDHIYVMGGKSGKAHAYATAYQNREVLCLNVEDKDAAWASVAENLGLQGLAIVSHGGNIYRIGGLEAKNDEGAEHDLHSVSEVLQFNPKKPAWTPMPSLPEGRSSIDACVVGDKIFVVGGWKMDGDAEPIWAEDMLVLDLAKLDQGWQSIPAPFSTRALAVRSLAGNLIVVGGIDEEGGTTAAVHLFDLENQTWRRGPEVPTAGSMKAFGCSAVTVGDHFFVSTYDGEIFRLDEGQEKWELVHQLKSGRFFHQMLPVGQDSFALVGGSHMEHGGKLEIEVFEVLANK